MFSDNDGALGYMTGQNNGDFGGGSWIWLLILLVLFFGYGGNGMFGNAGSSTASGITDGYVLTSDFANIERKIDGVDNGLCSGFYTQAQLVNGLENTVQATRNDIVSTINAGTYDTGEKLTAINNNMMSGFCNTNNAINQGFSDLNYRLAEQSCQTRQAVADASRDIVDNQNANYRAMMDYFTQDKIATLSNENQALRFAASQQAQNAYLISQLNPNPIPAYNVPNPLTGSYGYTCPCSATT